MAECETTTTVTGDLSVENRQFTCSICIGIYKTPRYLPTCGHTFCEDCLLTYIRNTQQQCQGSKFQCPICRKLNNLPEHDEVSPQWVQTFPQNTVIAKMMAESLPQSSEQVKEERICDPCKDEGETNSGFRYCMDCKEVLCKTCTKYHKKMRMSKNHKLADLNEIAAATCNSELFGSVGKCATHHDRDVEFYCKTHDDVICLKCSFQHVGCDVTEIAESGIDSAELQKDTERFMTHMKAALDHVDLLQKLRMEIKNNLKQKLKEIRENVEQIRDKIVELMNNVVSHVAEVTKQIEIAREDEINVDMSRVANIKEQTEKNVAVLDTFRQHGSNRHLYVSTYVIRKQLIETNAQISEEDKHVKSFDVKLIVDDKLQKLIESTDADKFIKITVNGSKSNHASFAAVSVPQRDLSTELNTLRDSRLVKVEEHTVRLDARREPNAYRGVAVCRDGRVILGQYHNPGYLCLYNPTNKSMVKQQLTKGPHSAVEINDAQLAVSTGWDKTIYVVTVRGEDIKIEKTFTTKNMPCTIVSLNTGLLAVAWDQPPAFSVVDIRGSELVQKSYMDQDTTGRKFKSFDYLAVDEKSQHVIQPCHLDKAVYCFDLNGKPVFKYTHPELTKPQGVALDRCGNIYVCEYNNNSMHKLSPTGDPISVITESVPPCPWAICSDVTSTGFWVTRKSSTYDQVVYFRLE